MNGTIQNVSESAQKATPLEFEAARAIVIGQLKQAGGAHQAETVELENAYGRILAEPARADRDYPACRRSLRDGFAVRSSDLPGTLQVRGEVRAGEAGEVAIGPGEALEVMTGAPLPAGADTVVMIEHVEKTSWSAYASAPGQQSTVKIERTAEPGQFINEKGAEARGGAVLIPEGTRLDASHIATLATIGYRSARVVRKPSIAILATGDEIVGLEEQPLTHQIRNSNSYMLASLVRAAGGEPHILPIARDTPGALRPLLEKGLSHDLLIVSGGVSAGKYDLVKPTLRELGATFHFERVRVQPGQPTAFGVLNGKPVFGLPGNPGSSLITFQLFARPAIEMLGGLADPILPLLSARFEKPFRHKIGLTRFLPALLNADGQRLQHIPWQGSSDIPALARANCFLVADHDRESWNEGDSIRVMLKT